MLFDGPDNPHKLSLAFGVSGPPIQHMLPWAHPSQPTEQHLDPFGHFYKAHERNQQTDTQTDHATPSVAIGRI